ncbi:ly6/PLAUR domain-containing protein 3-like isoform X1 [Pleurodeles waltl]|uniref:ly6/PLAUR domain-containing protein 3-like isoform X1 n=1 Tax=Pleurodeles waltl TaxID=8319 RepID=UPI003709B379
MEAGRLAQVLRKVALPGMLMAVLLAQGVASLRCYSCRDVGDGGCATDRIKIEECTPPQNVCLESFAIIIIDKQNVSATIKGCDLGTHRNEDFTTSSNGRWKYHACSEDLCNTLVAEDLVHQPLPTLTGNSSSIPSNQECYSCISTSEDRCSAQNAAVVRCPDHSPICYQGNGTIVLGTQHNITLSYFVKKCCHYSRCAGRSQVHSQYLNLNEETSFCQGNLCNTPMPNGGLLSATYVAPLIMAAALAITSL